MTHDRRALDGDLIHHGGAPQLIAYADRLGGTLNGLRDLLDGPLAGAFGGVHVLPFYLPYDGADAGFDPQDHCAVDPRLGTWQDLRDLGIGRTIMADVIVNHVSADSARFKDVRAKGEASRWSGMFLTFSSVFPDGATEEDLARIYRPRPGLPFTAMTLGDHRRLVWTTFTPAQVDLNLTNPIGWDYIASVIDTLTDAGVTLLRLDAVGYSGKEAGTDCFMTPSAYDLMDRITRHAHARGAEVLVEVHGHYHQQIEIAERVDYVYDFALPPLVLHALTTADLQPLGAWLDVRPSNTITVLDTHDGIGIVDVGPSALLPGEPGLLEPEQIDALVEQIHENSCGTSRRSTGAAASNLDLYQVNCTFYDALGQDDRLYLMARLIQLFVPGTPQVYYVGLLAGVNDMDLLDRTGVGRDVNRHHYTAVEIGEALDRPVVKALIGALRLRAAHPAFHGTFNCTMEGTRASLAWHNDEDVASLDLDVAARTYRVSVSEPGARVSIAAWE